MTPGGHATEVGSSKTNLTHLNLDPEVLGRGTHLNASERSRGIAIKLRDVDSLIARPIGSQLQQPFAQLSRRAKRVGALPVVHSDREMDQRLQEQPGRPSLRRPEFLEHFMTLEEMARIEQLDAARQPVPSYGRTNNLPTPSSYFSFMANASLILSSGLECVTTGANSVG